MFNISATNFRCITLFNADRLEEMSVYIYIIYGYHLDYRSVVTTIRVFHVYHKNCKPC